MPKIVINTSTEVEHPKVKDNTATADHDKQPRYKNDKLMIFTILVASIIAFLLYAIPDWVFLEIPTRDLIQALLTLVGIPNVSIPYNGQNVIPDSLTGGSFPFIEATKETPGIFLPITNGQYWIVKSCTGMQAGSLLLAIIFVTEATWKAKAKASVAFFITLFIGNVLRIAFHLWSVIMLYQFFNMDADTAFYWAHDVSSKVIGFFGTIFFAMVIEKMDVPIIDQFADWLDWVWWRGNWLLDKIMGKSN